VALAANDMARARESAELLGAMAEPAGMRSVTLFPWRGHLARVSLVEGDTEAAREYAELNLAISDGQAPAARADALITAAPCDSQRREALLKEAAECAERDERRLVQARAIASLGAVQRRAGDVSGCRDALLAALEIAHACDAGR
jgi:hypothetical protein